MCSTSRPSESRWGILVWCSAYLLIVCAVHLQFMPFVDHDVPYHIAVGRLMRQHGILHAFPWTPFSWLSDRYADDRFLFHLLYVPLAGLSGTTAARIVGTLAGTAILLSLHLVLRAERVPFAGLCALLPLAVSIPFISRFLLIRPHLLSIALAPVFLWAAVRGRLWLLAALSAIYPLTYVAFWQLPLLLLIAAATARLLAGEPIPWERALVVLGGIAVGVTLHPNSLNLLQYSWIVMVDVLIRNTWLGEAGFNMASELAPYPLGAWVQGLSIPVLMTLSAPLPAWRRRRDDVVPLAFTLAALGFCVLTIRSARFAEYFVPFAVVAFALVARQLPWRFLLPTVLAVSLLWTLVLGQRTFSNWAAKTEPLPAEIAARLQQEIPPGAQVFTVNWDYTGLLLLMLPDRYFLVALDPTLFHLKDPQLYRLWYRITHFPRPGIADIIRERFGAQFVVIYLPPASQAFNFQLASEPGVRILLNARDWMVFDLRPAPRSTPPPQP